MFDRRLLTDVGLAILIAVPATLHGGPNFRLADRQASAPEAPATAGVLASAEQTFSARTS